MSSDTLQNTKRMKFRGISTHTMNGIHFYNFLWDRNGDDQQFSTLKTL